MGKMLSQGKVGRDKLITYASRSLSDTEKKYATYEKEAQNSEEPCSRVSRCRLKLADKVVDVVYKAGKMNVNADALSRNLLMITKRDQNIYKLTKTIFFKTVTTRGKKIR